MFDFLIALSGGFGVIAAALAVIFGHRGDTYKALGYEEEAAKSYKIMLYCYCFIFLWIAAAILIPVFFCK